MKKHLFLTLLACFVLGLATTIQLVPGVTLFAQSALYITSVMFFAVVAFTSMQKLKDFIIKHDK